MFGTRRHARYPINLRLRLQLPGGELETTTEDVSLAGFSAPCPTLTEDGRQFGFAVTLPDGRVVTGQASAMRVSSDGLSGFSCDFEKESLPVWEGFLEQEKSSGGLWRMLSRYARSGEGESTRAVVEKGRFETLFKRESASAVRLHMVGENGEAYRIAFEKDPGEPFEQSAFASASPTLLELVKRAASRMLSKDVYLRRTAGAAIEPVRIVELKRGGFAFVVQHANGKPSLMGLHGSELMVVEVDGAPVFPNFTPDDLERIASDTFRRELEPTPSPTPATPIVHEGFAQQYHHAVVSSRPTAVSLDDVRAAMHGSQRVQTRTYGARTLKLFPDVWLYAEQAGLPAALRGFAVEDGEAVCVFVLQGQGAPRVLKLTPADLVALIRDA